MRNALRPEKRFLRANDRKRSIAERGLPRENGKPNWLSAYRASKRRNTGVAPGSLERIVNDACANDITLLWMRTSRM